MSLRAFLEATYRRFNDSRFISPDPLEFVLRYESPDDREVVALLASALAFGRVEQIRRSVADALARLRPGPAAGVRLLGLEELREACRSFRHRFCSGEDLARFLCGIGEVRRRWGSLNAYFVQHCCRSSGRAGWDTQSALCSFATGLKALGGGGGFLVPDPSRGSACKRLHLFLRWMVRRDRVDPGTWQGVAPAALMVPLDTHMHRVCRALGLTRRAQADVRTVREVTEGFRRLCPQDPVRYDFCLTRLGMRGETQGLNQVGHLQKLRSRIQ